MSTGLPPLPGIGSDIDLVLDVYTHSSLRRPGAPLNDDYGDTIRLKELGEKVFDQVVTHHFFNERPILSGQELDVKRRSIIADTNIDTWVKHYGLKEKIRVAPTHAHLLDDPRETSTFFYIYLGALYTRGRDLSVIQSWISRLIDPTGNISSSLLFQNLRLEPDQPVARSSSQTTQPPGQPSNAPPAAPIPPLPTDLPPLF